MKRYRTHPQHAGFTLIEIMVVVAIIGTLTAIAIPNYSEYVLRSQRANARTALLQTAQWLERAATAQGTYPICNTTTTPAALAACQVPAGVRAVEGGRYRLDVNSQTATYVLTATPLAGQLADRCATFTLNQANVRTQVGTSTVPTPLTGAECWAR